LAEVQFSHLVIARHPPFFPDFLENFGKSRFLPPHRHPLQIIAIDRAARPSPIMLGGGMLAPIKQPLLDIRFGSKKIVACFRNCSHRSALLILNYWPEILARFWAQG
jgi:hypothetical protein